MAHLIKSNFIYAIFILVVLIFAGGCSDDHGLEPIRSGISGTITYLGEWPAKTSEVRIVAATQFPPTDINDLIIGDVLALGGESTEYTFYLSPGDYYLGLVWREQNAAWGIQSIFGLHLEEGNPFSPALVHVPDAETVVTGKNIEADFAKARRGSSSSISGTVRFVGTWPAQVEGFMVIASTIFPPTTLLDFSFSSILPGYVDSTEYSIAASPGTYKAVGLVMKLIDQPWALENIVGILLEENSFQPREVVVPTEDSQIEDIDFTVYFREK